MIRRRSVAALLLVAVASAACGGEASDPTLAGNCRLQPLQEGPDRELPADFPWPEEVGITKTRVKKKFVTVEGYERASVKELFDLEHRQVTTNDFEVITTDYEGFEAEIYFARGSSIAGVVRLREGPCDGYVTMSVLYDPLTTAKGKEAVNKTRELKRSGGASSN